MLNLRYFFVCILPLAGPRQAFELTSWLLQGKFGVDKKFPTLSLVNDLLFVVAFFFARIIGGSRDVSPQYPFHTRSVTCIDSLDSVQQSFVFFREMITRWDQIPTFLFLVVSQIRNHI